MTPPRAPDAFHFTHGRYARMTRAMSFLNNIFTAIGTYGTLGDELRPANAAGFGVQRVQQIPLTHRHKSLARWPASVQSHQLAQQASLGADTYPRDRTCWERVPRVHGGSAPALDAVASHTIPLPESRP